jgi:hypothetical protein
MTLKSLLALLPRHSAVHKPAAQSLARMLQSERDVCRHELMAMSLDFTSGSLPETVSGEGLRT